MVLKLVMRCAVRWHLLHVGCFESGTDVGRSHITGYRSKHYFQPYLRRHRDKTPRCLVSDVPSVSMRDEEASVATRLETACLGMPIT